MGSLDGPSLTLAGWFRLDEQLAGDRAAGDVLLVNLLYSLSVNQTAVDNVSMLSMASSVARVGSALQLLWWAHGHRLKRSFAASYTVSPAPRLVQNTPTVWGTRLRVYYVVMI